MKVDFPDPNNRIHDIPPELISRAYQLQIDMHTYYIKHQSERNFFYTKFLGYFLLVAVGYFVLQDYGILSNFLAGTIIIGICTLYVMFSNAIFLDPEWDCNLKHCIQAGKSLEEKHPNLISLDLFHRYEDLQPVSFRGAFMNRFVPFALVLILTSVASTVLSMNVGLKLSIAIGIFTFILLITSGFFFRGIIRKNFI